MAGSTIPFIPPGTTFTSLLRKRATENPDKSAYVFFDINLDKLILTRKEVWDKSRKFAAILRRHGVKKGDIVCNTLVNSPERLLTALGTTLAGAISMHAQVYLSDGEDLIHNCTVSKCSTIIVDPGQSNGALPILKRIEYRDENTGEIRYTGLPNLKRMIEFRVCSSNEEEAFQRGRFTLEDESEMYEETDSTEDELAFIFTTSGTTGFSKLVPHTHKRCLRIIATLASVYGARDENSVCYCGSSLGWIAGYPGMMLTYGLTRVLTDLSLGTPANMDDHVVNIFNAIEIDSAMMPPVVVRSLTKFLKSGYQIKRRCNALAAGGSPLTKVLLDAVGRVTDSLKGIYGMTECGVVSSFHFEAGTPFKDYCVGKPLEGFEIKIVDEMNDEVSAETVGQLAIRGPTVMSGYFNNEEKSKQVLLEDGFYLSGDMAYKDQNGYIFIKGRKAEVICKGTYMHYPGFIESRLREYAGVESVAVIGVPDPVFMEEVCACVIPSKTGNLSIDQLRDYCDNLFLPGKSAEISANPKHFLLFESLPHNNTGKLDRRRLTAEACKRLGLEYKDKSYQ